MPSGESGKKKVNVVRLLPNVSVVCVVKNYVRNRYGRVGVYNNNVTHRGGIRDCSNRRGVLGYIVRKTRFYFIRIFFPPLTPPGECTRMCGAKIITENKFNVTSRTRAAMRTMCTHTHKHTTHTCLYVCILSLFSTSANARIIKR